MIVTEVVIHTLPGRAAAVEAHLEQVVPGFQSRRVAGEDRILGSWCVPSGQAQALAEVLQSFDPDIVSVNPTILALIGE